MQKKQLQAEREEEHLYTYWCPFCQATPDEPHVEDCPLAPDTAPHTDDDQHGPDTVFED